MHASRFSDSHKALALAASGAIIAGLRVGGPGHPIGEDWVGAADAGRRPYPQSPPGHPATAPCRIERLLQAATLEFLVGDHDEEQEAVVMRSCDV